MLGINWNIVIFMIKAIHLICILNLSVILQEIFWTLIVLFYTFIFYRGTSNKEIKDIDMEIKGTTDKLSEDVRSVCLPKGLLMKFPGNSLQTMILTGAKGSQVRYMWFMNWGWGCRGKWGIYTLTSVLCIVSILHFQIFGPFMNIFLKVQDFWLVNVLWQAGLILLRFDQPIVKALL